MKPAPQHHVPQDAVALQITPHTNHPIPSNASRPSRASASSRTKRRPIGAPPVPVRTEFVFSSMNTYSVVLLCGDWSDWRPIRMTLEQETVAGRIWSVITIVPSGYREFCYLADAHYMVSTKHPTNPQGTRNWRNVYGPPQRLRRFPHNPSQPNIAYAIDKLADSVQTLFFPPSQIDPINNSPDKTVSGLSSHGRDVDDIENVLKVIQVGRTASLKRLTATQVAFRLSIAALLICLTCLAFMYIVGVFR